MESSLENKVEQVKQWLLEKKAEDIVSVDVRDKCSFTEFIVVCSGSATLHNKAIAEYLIDKAQENHIKLLGKEGFDACVWILLDLNEIIVHIFSEDVRSLYKIEDLWTKKMMPNEQNDFDVNSEELND
ncbi:MAG: ribosome silencing factor [Candidatus Cloacimonetes bacterium]|jgi:ribosome-associated protein|nr:ribosome silencing factor [Candidatus Cloacimonadota bacterium]